MQRRNAVPDTDHRDSCGPPDGGERTRKRLRKSTGAARRLAAVLVVCFLFAFLFAACNALLPGGFEFTSENGQLCDAAGKGGDCASGFCSGDGICCAETCSGPCQSCKGGATCTVVPEDAKGACTGKDVCSAGGLCYCSNQRFVGPPARPAYLVGPRPSSVVALDLNGDGKPDLATANGDDTTHTVSVLRSKGDGTFYPKVDYPTGLYPSSIAALDLNGDGKPDLAVANSGAATVSVLRGKGDGTFDAKVDYDTGQLPSSVAALDLDGDGLPDLALANKGDNTVSVLRNNGDGTFTAKVDYPTGQFPRSVAAMDLNDDGRPDLAVANIGDNTVSVLRNNGDGTFAAQVTYPTGLVPSSLAAMDLNGDGRPDLAVANDIDHSVTVLLNDCQ